MAVVLARNQSISLLTKEIVVFEYVNPDTEIDFPAQWFRDHPQTKPTVTIKKTASSFIDIANAVRGGIRGSNLTIDTAKKYLHLYGTRMQGLLDVNWRTFNLDIGIAAANITPWDIVTIREDGDFVPTENIGVQGAAAAPRMGNPNEALNWSYRALAMYILCIYRLTKISNEEYRDNLIKRLETQISAEGGKGMTFHGATGIYGGWANDRGFLKMVAAYDMFLHYFRDHEESILRLGTLGSRYRDCAGMLTYGYAMKILNIGSDELMDWIFVQTMAIEMARISTAGQESGNKFSYFPYQSDLGLVNKCAYYSNANPYLFHWIHIIGSLIGHRRSCNARFTFEGSYADIGLNAVLVTWVFARGGELAPYDAAGQDYGTALEVADTEEDEDDLVVALDQTWTETQGRVPRTWFALLKTGGFRVPGVVNRVIARQRGKIGEVRDQSVGEYVKNKFVY